MTGNKIANAVTRSLGVLALGASVGSATSAASQAEQTAITIYSSAQPGGIAAEYYRPVPGAGVSSASAIPGYAMVRHERDVTLGAGRSNLRFSDVAGLIDPTTVTFSSLTDSGARVLEQNFQFDLVSSDKLLQKYIDKPVSIERNVGNQASVTSGTLLSSVDGLVLRGSDGSIHSLREWSAVKFGELPGGLITRPTLDWLVSASKGGEHRARVTYQTGGITWWADYNLIFNEGRDANSGMLDLSAWVSILNQSGASYPDAKLKLIAGDVHRAEPATDMRARGMVMASAVMREEKDSFVQKDFFEFHLYTLGRRTTLANNSTKQIELFDQAKQIPAKKLLVYAGQAGVPLFDSPYTERNYGDAGNKKVDVYLEFRNDKQFGLGVPLPAGRVRVSQLDAADSSLEFIGEDRIDHTPKDETLRIKLGSAFDVVGERKQVDFAIDTKGRWMEEEIEIKLRNHKTLPVDVIVQESLYRWTNWKLVSKSHEYSKENARLIHFPVHIVKDGEAMVRYRVRYAW